MQALLCRDFGLPEKLTLENIPSPVAAADEVVISVKACGVNFPDVLIIQNKYQFKPDLPFSPGGEVAGVVKEAGSGVKHLKAGDRVVALSGWGGFAEEVKANAKRVFPMPAGLSFLNAAGTLYTYGTSFHALKDRAQLKPGETLLVLGAGGGVGLAAVELGKLLGATVITAASSEEKLAVCKLKGAAHLINYTKEDLRQRIKEITGDKGVDVVYDPVGGAYAEPALRSMAWKGRYLVVGFASGVIPQFPGNLPLLKGCSIMGVFWGSFAEREPQHSLMNFAELLGWIQQGKIKQHISRVYTLAEGASALSDLLNRKVLGKAIVKVGDWTETPVEEKLPTGETIHAPIRSKPLRIHLKDLKKHAGDSLPVSDWLTVTQKMIDDFANATLDHQWIHVDVERARNELPGGKTIAHGYLTMSLASHFFFEILAIDGVTTSINYGLNKARFPSAVKSGSRIRMSGRIMQVEDMPGGQKLFLECKMEVEGEEKPAYIGELITALY